MSRVKLDRIDRRILHDLQEDGRMTNVQLARNAEISAPPCLRRVRALEEGGFIALVTPATGQAERVDAHEIQQACTTAGLTASGASTGGPPCRCRSTATWTPF